MESLMDYKFRCKQSGNSITVHSEEDAESVRKEAGYEEITGIEIDVNQEEPENGLQEERQEAAKEVKRPGRPKKK